ncbi:replication initiator RepC [Thalassobius sp. Cn5-15]|nr:plasmid replication protein RepC [Thalassobius sp. Cn5-15]MCG7495070.1 replication initiator RepC [Thalassobius sp. Cn5-15]
MVSFGQTAGDVTVQNCFTTSDSEGTPAVGHDKWQLLEALTTAAALYDLSHRTLSVLRALISFHPHRLLTDEVGSAIVFPANRTLSKRLHGMPESTLRRHLARLVDLGVITRHDSPNRKRFARRVGGFVGQAYGFDLSPLARHGDQLMQAAHAAEEAQQRLAMMRAEVLHLRARYLCNRNVDTVFLAEMNRLLRRRPDADTLHDLLGQLQERLTNTTDETDTLPALTADNRAEKTPENTACNPTTMSVNHSQNERHIQSEKKYNSDSDTPSTKQNQTKIKCSEDGTASLIAKKDITLAEVVSQCPTLSAFFPGQLTSWQALANIAQQLVPMMGIDQPVWIEAVNNLGLHKAAVSVVAIHERFDQIQNPGAYLRHLSRSHKVTALNIHAVLIRQGDRIGSCEGSKY